MENGCIPCWLTKYQQDQAKVLLDIGLVFTELDNLFDEPLWEESEKVEEWEFLADLPSKPLKKDDYPNGNEYVIYARCNAAIFILYFQSQADNYKDALAEHNELMKDFNTAKKSIKAISKVYSANFKQLCLV